MILDNWAQRWNIPPHALAELRNLIGVFDIPTSAPGKSETSAQHPGLTAFPVGCPSKRPCSQGTKNGSGRGIHKRDIRADSYPGGQKTIVVRDCLLFLTGKAHVSEQLPAQR